MILVLGATGLIGGLVCTMLGGRTRIRLLARRSVDPGALGCAGAEVALGDLDDPASLRAAVEGVTATLLVSPSNPDMVRQQGNLVRALAAYAPECRVVKISGFMTTPGSPSRSGAWHAEIEALVEQAGLPFVFLRPPHFMQNFARLALAAGRDGVIEASIGEARFASIDARDIAAVACECLVEARHAGERYLLTGPRAIGYDDVAAALSRMSGRAIVYRPITMEQARRDLETSGLPAWRVEVLMEFARGFADGLGTELSPAVRHVTGRAPRDLVDFMADHAFEFG